MPQQTKQTFPLEYRSLESTSKLKKKVPRKDEEITEKLQLKIKTVEDIDVKMTQTDLKETKVLKPCSVHMATGWVCTLLDASGPMSSEKL